MEKLYVEKNTHIKHLGILPLKMWMLELSQTLFKKYKTTPKLCKREKAQLPALLLPAFLFRIYSPTSNKGEVKLIGWSGMQGGGPETHGLQRSLQDGSTITGFTDSQRLKLKPLRTATPPSSQCCSLAFPTILQFYDIIWVFVKCVPQYLSTLDFTRV